LHDGLIQQQWLRLFVWIPAFAGMTEWAAGMTEWAAGMTEWAAAMRPDDAA